jgi:hypothetical protein
VETMASVLSAQRKTTCRWWLDRSQHSLPVYDAIREGTQQQMPAEVVSEIAQLGRTQIREAAEVQMSETRGTHAYNRTYMLLHSKRGWTCFKGSVRCIVEARTCERGASLRMSPLSKARC